MNLEGKWIVEIALTSIALFLVQWGAMKVRVAITGKKQDKETEVLQNIGTTAEVMKATFETFKAQLGESRSDMKAGLSNLQVMGAGVEVLRAELAAEKIETLRMRDLTHKERTDIQNKLIEAAREEARVETDLRNLHADIEDLKTRMSYLERRCRDITGDRS